MEELNYVIFAEGLKNWQRDLLYWILNLVASLFPGATFMGYAAPEVEPLDPDTMITVLNKIMLDMDPLSRYPFAGRLQQFLDEATPMSAQKRRTQRFINDTNRELEGKGDNIMGVNPISQLEIHKQIDEFLKKGPSDG